MNVLYKLFWAPNSDNLGSGKLDPDLPNSLSLGFFSSIREEEWKSRHRSSCRSARTAPYHPYHMLQCQAWRRQDLCRVGNPGPEVGG